MNGSGSVSFIPWRCTTAQPAPTNCGKIHSWCPPSWARRQRVRWGFPTRRAGMSRCPTASTARERAGSWPGSRTTACRRREVWCPARRRWRTGSGCTSHGGGSAIATCSGRQRWRRCTPPQVASGEPGDPQPPCSSSRVICLRSPSSTRPHRVCILANCAASRRSNRISLGRVHGP